MDCHAEQVLLAMMSCSNTVIASKYKVFAWQSIKNRLPRRTVRIAMTEFRATSHTVLVAVSPVCVRGMPCCRTYITEMNII